MSRCREREEPRSGCWRQSVPCLDQVTVARSLYIEGLSSNIPTGRDAAAPIVTIAGDEGRQAARGRPKGSDGEA